MKKVPLFHCTRPCSSCPYRKDAPLRLWAREEFEDLLRNDEENIIGKVYLCHKKNGGICVGFLMNQDERDFPSIALRVSLSEHGISREFLDKLNSPAPRFASIRAMIRANFPAILRGKPKAKPERGIHGARRAQRRR